VSFFKGTTENFSSESTSVLSLKNIKISFGDVIAVDDVSFDINPREVVGLIGENGAGKSTLLKILAGVYKADSGSVEIAGKVVNFKSPQDSVDAGIGIVHQEQSLFTNLTIAENLAFAGGGRNGSTSILKPFNWFKSIKDAAATLEKVGSKIDPRTRIGDLSFIDRQIVEIAKAIKVSSSQIANPVIILDEPTSLLEVHETDALEREIAKIKSIGSVIFVSHRLDEVMRLCDRVIVLRDGKLVATKDIGEVDQQELFRLMVGHEKTSELRTYERKHQGETPKVELRNVSKKGEFRDVNLNLVAGEITAIIGTNGSGREGLCKAIYGVKNFDTGSMLINGKEVNHWNVHEAIAQGFGFVPAERKVEGIIGGLSAADNISLIFSDDVKNGFFINPQKNLKIAKDWFEELDVRPRNPLKELEKFSGGNQQKVVLAKWLKSEKLSVLILDHPLRGLDPGAAETVNALIKKAALDGTAVLLLGDTMEEVLDIADQIMVMKDGQVAGNFDLHVDHPSTLDLLEKMV
jgi:ribose transport system ATP-binding protein